MKKPDDLNAYFNKYRQDPTIAKKSRTWFNQQQLALKNARVQVGKLFKEQRVTSRIIPGKLYMFYYDPKHADKLPYYDTFPLVFPYAKTENGFMGLNMHYLPYFHRVQLLTRLMEFASNTNFDENTKIRYSWQLIAGAAKFKVAQNCIKHYLNDHVDSAFIEIPGQDWHTAMMLPVERFVGSNKNRVWSESIKI